MRSSRYPFLHLSFIQCILPLPISSCVNFLPEPCRFLCLRISIELRHRLETIYYSQFSRRLKKNWSVSPIFSGYTLYYYPAKLGYFIYQTYICISPHFSLFANFSLVPFSCDHTPPWHPGCFQTLQLFSLLPSH
jgi:hypothetical protein